MFRCSWNECLNGEKYTELRNICAAKQKQKKQKQKQQKKKGGGVMSYIGYFGLIINMTRKTYQNNC